MLGADAPEYRTSKTPNLWLDAFAQEFNTFRPHQTFGRQTPAQYLVQLAADENPMSHMF